MAVMWNMLDDYLVDKVDSLDGVNDLFEGVDTIIAQQVDPDQAHDPTVLVRGLTADDVGTGGQIGDGVYHLEGIQYPYEIIYISRSTSREKAIEIAKAATAALRDVIRADICFGSVGADDAGEVVQRVVFGQRTVYIRGAHGQNRGQTYTAEGTISITVNTNV